jgi:hypothetical protein
MSNLNIHHLTQGESHVEWDELERDGCDQLLQIHTYMLLEQIVITSSHDQQNCSELYIFLYT